MCHEQEGVGEVDSEVTEIDSASAHEKQCVDRTRSTPYRTACLLRTVLYPKSKIRSAFITNNHESSTSLITKYTEH